MVKRFGRRISVGTAALLVVAGAGVGLPAYASTVEAEAESEQAQQVSEPQPRAQSLTVVKSSPVIDIVRDGYTVVVPPRLQYPLLTGTGITSGFGPRGGRMHEGDDIFPGYGTPIYSIAAGVVVTASGDGAYGNHVVVEHVIDGQMVTSLYAHMAPGTMAVSVGQQVGVGQHLGGVGETGNAQGAHLHFEIRPGGGAAVPPYAWLAARI
ncbi:MAG TPA: M23 family metallopeptidase [Homoserinimonas sp.]|nr:M23 family metallopeptidase [Homoserinimonas sp.]